MYPLSTIFISTLSDKISILSLILFATTKGLSPTEWDTGNAAAIAKSASILDGKSNFRKEEFHSTLKE